LLYALEENKKGEILLSYNSDFQQWLIDNKKYQKRSASDVSSRINRVKIFVNLPESIDDNVISALDNNSEFKQLSYSVRSQLRRALRLLKEYNNE
jgi:DNA (cytosine-5)-methyltransferase 1